MQIVQMYGRMACSEFALITGYFMVTSHKQDFTDKIVLTIADVMFYSLLITSAVLLINVDNVTINPLKSIFPFVFDNWFVVFYTILLLLIPTINKLIINLTQKELKKLLFMIIVIWSIIPTMTLNYWQFSNIDFFIVMYLIGAYIRKYGDHKNNYIHLVVALFAMITMAVSVLGFDILSITLQNDKFLRHAVDFKEYNNIFALIAAVYLFKFFVNMRFNNKIINWISPAVLGIYLISDNYLMRSIIWNIISPNANYVNKPYLHFVVKVLLVFIVCLLIDKIRNRIFAKWFNIRIVGFKNQMRDKLFKENI